LLNELEIRQCITDARIVFGKFCCEICNNFDEKQDKCRKTGDTGIKWRAHRTCCGRADWHVLKKSDTCYLQECYKLQKLMQLDDAEVFVSSFDKTVYLKLTKFLEAALVCTEYF
jgi:hypothetical protein